MLLMLLLLLGFLGGVDIKCCWVGVDRRGDDDGDGYCDRASDERDTAAGSFHRQSAVKQSVSH